MIVLPTTYFGPVSYYAALYHNDAVVIEAHEYYQKQTLRNRCVIATGQGAQTLSINVVKGNRPRTLITDIKLSDHGNWMHQHLYSLATYYGNSPFYEFYIDDIQEVMLKGRDGNLFDLNESLRKKVCELIGFTPNVAYSTEWQGKSLDISTWPQYEIPAYYQISESDGHQPFQRNMSILDLLFNMGPESILILESCKKI